MSAPRQIPAVTVRGRLTLMAGGNNDVTATCNQKHPGPDGGAPAACFWPIKDLIPANLATLSQGTPGPFRLTLATGRVLEGTLAPPAAGKQAPSVTSKAAAAIAAKTGKKGQQPKAPAKPAGRATGGAMTAAFNAVAAIAGAAGQTATAAGQAVSATAGAAGKMADAGRQGLIAAQAGIDAADHFGQRRHERKMSGSDQGEDPGGKDS